MSKCKFREQGIRRKIIDRGPCAAMSPEGEVFQLCAFTFKRMLLETALNLKNAARYSP